MERILFVDDNEAIIQAVKSLLAESNYQFFSAQDGIVGLCGLVEHRPDLIFVDANAAKLNGFQFCALVRGKGCYKNIPLILVLEREDFFERAKAKALGIENILCKPFGRAELFSIISVYQDKAA